MLYELRSEYKRTRDDATPSTARPVESDLGTEAQCYDLLPEKDGEESDTSGVEESLGERSRSWIEECMRWGCQWGWFSRNWNLSRYTRIEMAI